MLDLWWKIKRVEMHTQSIREFSDVLKNKMEELDQDIINKSNEVTESRDELEQFFREDAENVKAYDQTY